MATTIQISDNLLEKLKTMKIHEKESYENIIWDLIEDTMELSEQTKQNILESEKEIAEGKTTSWENVKKELNLKCMK